MLCTPILLAITFAQGAPPPPTHSTTTASPWDQLETMRRLIDQRLQAKAAEIGSPGRSQSLAGTVLDSSGAPVDGATVQPADPSSELDRYTVGTKPPADGSVTWQLLANQSPFTVTSHAEYVPGLGAVFSLEVPVRCELVEPPASDETEPKAPGKNEDDAEWEAVASGNGDGLLDSRMSVTRSWVSKSRTAATWKELAQQRSQATRFAPAAIEALKRSLLDTTLRFGHKLGLESGERLAVVVLARPAGGSSGLANSEGLTFWRGAMSQLSGASNADPLSSNLYDAQGRATGPAPQRLVIQISADDLAAFHTGHYDREDVEKRTKVKCYGEPVKSAAGK